MLSQRTIESCVGLFLLAAILALITLAFKVSGLTSFFKSAGYDVVANFDDIGQLKVRSPVKIGGVLVGEVSAINLDPASFKAVVKLHINYKFKAIPEDSSVSILTAGLLGDNYVAINPEYSQVFLKNGSVIQDTHSAMILEKLIGQLIYKLSNPAPASSNTTSNKENKSNNLALPPDETPKKSKPEKIPPAEINYEHNI
jgi:phospholipid/cholesterol/gamma-HCH transport system substrate-binding protein